jgi:hypothetical protein
MFLAPSEILDMIGQFASEETSRNLHIDDDSMLIQKNRMLSHYWDTTVPDAIRRRETGKLPGFKENRDNNPGLVYCRNIIMLQLVRWV